jgi:hypothetical protein
MLSAEPRPRASFNSRRATIWWQHTAQRHRGKSKQGGRRHGTAGSVGAGGGGEVTKAPIIVHTDAPWDCWFGRRRSQPPHSTTRPCKTVDTVVGYIPTAHHHTGMRGKRQGYSERSWKKCSEMAHHRPSDASTMNLSAGVMRHCRISGSAVTPWVFSIRSPMALREAAAQTNQCFVLRHQLELQVHFHCANAKRTTNNGAEGGGGGGGGGQHTGQTADSYLETASTPPTRHTP